MRRFLMVLTFKCCADKYRRQVGEDKGLEESNQYLDHINENSETNCHR